MATRKRKSSMDFEELFAQIPVALKVLPITNTVIYPYMIEPIIVERPHLIKLIEDVTNENRITSTISLSHSTCNFSIL